jgi:hypothetical protein
MPTVYFTFSVLVVYFPPVKMKAGEKYDINPPRKYGSSKQT